MARKAPYGIKYICGLVEDLNEADARFIEQVIDLPVNVAHHVTLGFGAQSVTPELLGYFLTNANKQFEASLTELVWQVDDHGAVAAARAVVYDPVVETLEANRRSLLHLTLHLSGQKSAVQSNNILVDSESNRVNISGDGIRFNCRLAAVLRRDDRIVLNASELTGVA